MPPLLEINAKAKKQPTQEVVSVEDGWKPITPGVDLKLNVDYKTKDKRTVVFQILHERPEGIYLLGRFKASNGEVGPHQYLWTKQGKYAGRPSLLMYPDGALDSKANVAKEKDEGLSLEEAWALYSHGVPLKYRNKAVGATWYPYPTLFPRIVFETHYAAYMFVRKMS